MQAGDGGDRLASVQADEEKAGAGLRLGGDDRARAMAGAAAWPFSADQPPIHEAEHGALRVGYPQAEQVARPGICGRSVRLLRRAEPQDEPQRVDMRLEQPAYRRVAAAAQDQKLAQKIGARRFGAGAKSAMIFGERCCKQPRAGQAAHISFGERTRGIQGDCVGLHIGHM